MMLNDLVSQIVSGVIAGIILIGITYLFRLNIKFFLVGCINKLTTGNTIELKLKYRTAQKFIERKLKNAKKLRVLAFMGKDLVVEPGFLAINKKSILHRAIENLFNYYNNISEEWGVKNEERKR